MALVALVVAALVGGASYQSIATAREARRFPPPGQLVDVEGFRLHIDCEGEGSPTVILDAGLGGSSLDWSRIRPRVADTTRVCSYDRAGFGWSDAGPEPRTARRVSEELKRLLDGGGIEGPYVLVSHSWAGFYGRYFAHRYPESVAGLLLIDTSHEDEVASWIDGQMRQLALCRSLAPIGVPRLAGVFAGAAAALPAEVRPPYEAHTNRTGYCGSMYAELAAFDETKTQVTSFESLGDTPLVVLFPPPTHPALHPEGTSPEAISATVASRAEHQRELAGSSSAGRFVTVEGSGHHVHWDAPSVVVAAIERLVGAR